MQMRQRHPATSAVPSFVAIETLEGRRLLSASIVNGVLNVLGSQRADDVVISRDPANSSRILVKVNGHEDSFRAKGIRTINVVTGRSDDRITVDDSHGSVAIARSIDAGDGNDSVTGGAGTDSVNGNLGDDVISGRRGNDVLSGGAGDDTVVGGDGNDSINGDDGNDKLEGDAGDDSLAGGADNDTVSGDDGNDHAFGNGGSDSVSGGAGDDMIDGGTGGDTVSGGDGNDTFDHRHDDNSQITDETSHDN